MLLSRGICLFIIYSFFGWVYETLYCTVRTAHWANRGFLYGPICPIYGVGAILITFLAGLLPRTLTRERLAVYVIAFFGSMVLEYVTSLILEVLFHAVWWDYHDVPLNIQGRTSVPTSMCFGVAGIFVVYYLAPEVESWVDMILPFHMEWLALLITSIFSVDMTLTVSALTNMARIVDSMDEAFNNKMENFVESAQRKTSAIWNQVAVESMGNIRKLALRRVIDFRYPSISSDSVRHLIRYRRERTLEKDGKRD